MNDIKLLKGRIEPWQDLVQRVDDLEALYELGLEENDKSIESELKEQYEKAKADYINGRKCLWCLMWLPCL